MVIHEMNLKQLVPYATNEGWKLCMASMRNAASVANADTLSFMGVGTGDLIIVGLSGKNGIPVIGGTASVVGGMPGYPPNGLDGSAKHVDLAIENELWEASTAGTAYDVKGLVIARNIKD